MSLSTNVSDLATRVATECKALRTLINGNAADLSGLATTVKSSLVAAVNELKGALDAVGTPATINDAATNGTQTWSSNKITGEIGAALNALLDGAPAALDTLNELAAAIADDAAFSSTVTTALGNRVRTDTAAQGLNGTQQGNARSNIGAAATADVGNTAADFVATFNSGLT
jgi:hypothetical protein